MKLTNKEGAELSPQMQRAAIQALTSTNDTIRSQAYAALQLPLRRALDEESSVRRIFQTVTLGAQDDAIFPVDTDDEVEVVVASAYGIPPISMFVTDVVTVNTDTYQGGWEIPEQMVSSGRIDQVSRNSRRLINGFIAKEEDTGWSVIKSCVSGTNTSEVVGTGADLCSLELLNLLQIASQEKGYVIDQLWVSPGSMGDLRMYCKEAGLPNEVRFDLWKNGMIKGLWGMDIYAYRTLGDDYIYGFDTSRFGVMPIRQELETRQDPTAASQFKVRVYAQEQVGFCAIQKDAIFVGKTGKSA